MKCARIGLLFLLFLAKNFAQEIQEGLQSQACLFNIRGLFWNIGALTKDEDYIVYSQDKLDSVTFNI